MVDFAEYVKGILQQIKDSYQILEGLGDKPGDLEIIKIELLKINGWFQVIVKKIESSENRSDTYSQLFKRSKYYLDNYDFGREIDTMSNLYSEDTNRLKNIRYKILEALTDRKLMEKVDSIIHNE